MDLTPEDARNILIFMERVDLKGHEAMAYVIIQNKLVPLASQFKPLEIAK